MIRQAKWITGGVQTPDASLLLRKTFEVIEEIKTATVQICAVGLGVCTINGQKITEDVLTTPYTKYDKRLIYNEYDVAPLLKNGKNILVIHLGNGFFHNNMTTSLDLYASWRQHPRCAFSMLVEYTNGNVEYINSDNTWKTMFGPCVYNHMRQGEWYDARLIDKAFWDGEQDELYKNAKITRPPGGVLEKMDMPPIRIVETLSPIEVKDNIYDFGVNISGFAEISFVGQPGQEIKLTYDEILNAEEVNGRNSALFAIRENTKLKHEDIYVCKGSGREMYSPTFCYHGFRYVKVENAPKDFQIVAKYIHTDLQQIGEFSCSDEMLNKIHQASIRSTLCNYMGIPTDCPHREQNGWTGDALLSADQCLMNFDMVKAYKKWMNDFKDMQRPNGQLPSIIPSASNWGYNSGSGPAWDSAIIHIPYKTYLLTGNDSLIKQMWKNMCSYMDFMDIMSMDGIIGFGLGDWCYPTDFTDVKILPVEITDTAYYHINCILMAKMAKHLGYDDTQWLEKAKQIKQAWRNKYLSDDTYQNSQTFLACAIYQELLEEEEVPVYAQKLADLVVQCGYHIVAGILGTKYILNALSENGYAEVVYKAITNPAYPSYAHWIYSGMTTLGENWRPHKESDNHHMFSEVDNWFYRYLAGIKYTEDGLIIKPALLKEVENVYAKHGDLVINITKDDITVKVPCNAKIILRNQEISVEKGEYTYKI